MKRKGAVGLIFSTVLVIALAVILAATCWTVNHYIVLNWQLYPKNQQVLDLRDRAVTLKEYRTLSWRMPDTTILWTVPLCGDYFPNDAQELTIRRLDQSDVDGFAYFPNLQVIHAEECTDYANLSLLWKQYPQVDVRYTVPIGGQEYTPDATAVTPTTLTQTDVQNLSGLPNLQKIDGTGCRDFVILRQLERDHPEWDVQYITSIAGTEFTPTTRSLELTGAAYEELSIGLAAMPELKTLSVHAPNATGAQMLQLREEYPNVEIHWDLEVFGQTFPDDAAEVDISNQPISSIDEAKQIAALFPNLTKLIVNSVGIDNEVMAAYREEVRSDYKVVWTIYFSDKCKGRTDDTYFMPTKQGEYYFKDSYTHDLRYFEDMVCLDLGDHNNVKNIEYVAFMPHLKYLILAWTQVTDLSPISNCKELIYLEVDHCIVHDYTPLLGCTALEDINIGDAQYQVDVTPLTQMPWLKNVWAQDRSPRDGQILREGLPNTHVVTSKPPAGQGWRNLQNYYDMRDYLGMYYMN